MANSRSLEAPTRLKTMLFDGPVPRSKKRAQLALAVGLAQTSKEKPLGKEANPAGRATWPLTPSNFAEVSVLLGMAPGWARVTPPVYVAVLPLPEASVAVVPEGSPRR
jgi:hypothetical protein